MGKQGKGRNQATLTRLIRRKKKGVHLEAEFWGSSGGVGGSLFFGAAQIAVKAAPQ